MSAAELIPKLHMRAQVHAPQHPPCFDSQDEWVDYVAWAVAAQDTAVKPFVDRRSRGLGKLGEFSTAFDFCSDCTIQHRAAMRQAGRCVPNWLVMMAKEAA